MSSSDRALQLARWWALSRLAVGGVAVVAPSAISRLLSAPDPREPIQRLVVRNVGGRDIVLGLALSVSLFGRGRPRPWIAVAALVDLLDLGAALADWSDLPRWQRRLVAGSAAGSVVVSAVVAAALRDKPHQA